MNMQNKSNTSKSRVDGCCDGHYTSNRRLIPVVAIELNGTARVNVVERRDGQDGTETREEVHNFDELTVTVSVDEKYLDREQETRLNLLKGLVAWYKNYSERVTARFLSWLSDSRK